MITHVIDDVILKRSPKRRLYVNGITPSHMITPFFTVSKRTAKILERSSTYVRSLKTFLGYWANLVPYFLMLSMHVLDIVTGSIEADLSKVDPSKWMDRVT